MKLLLLRLAESFTTKESAKLFFGGKTNMLRQPEFHDVDKIHSLLSMIEQEQGFYDLIKQKSTGITVKIGRENQNSVLEECSLITATYSVGEDQVGTLAILGPTRMEYSRVITLLSTFSNDLTTLLTRLYQKLLT